MRLDCITRSNWNPTAIISASYFWRGARKYRGGKKRTFLVRKLSQTKHRFAWVVFFNVVSRFMNLKMRSMVFEDSLFEECFFEDITSSNTFFKNCTFIATLFYNTGRTEACVWPTESHIQNHTLTNTEMLNGPSSAPPPSPVILFQIFLSTDWSTADWSTALSCTTKRAACSVTSATRTTPTWSILSVFWELWPSYLGT